MGGQNLTDGRKGDTATKAIDHLGTDCALQFRHVVANR
jgi:hypothetical protein